MNLDRLFNPISVKGLKLPNRIVMPPMATNYASPEGFVTERQIAYYVERAKGGVGYITVEHTGILQQGKASPRMLLISTDEHAAYIKQLIDAVHEAGARIFVQINHAGRQTTPAVTGMPIVGPSAVSHLPHPPQEMIPRQLSVREIEEIIEAFTTAAHRVKEAGADGVELHMAHGYLICSFLSPFSNKRTDSYGGDLNARARLAVEVLRSVRNRVGEDFPVSCRLSADEYVEGGLKIEETRQIARILENEGADILHVSAANAASVYMNHPPYYLPEGVFVPFAEAIKSEVQIPVITVGRIRTPAMADQIIKEGRADLVAMGRALLADPHLPNKAKEGRFEDIIPCISCNKCIATLRKDSVGCSVNPKTGCELTFQISKTNDPKHIWVVGGGPGGLKAAEVAAERGHRVTLFEKKEKLGGRVRVGASPPGKQVLIEFIDYLEGRIKALGVSLETNREFKVQMVDEDRPDAVIVATGALPVFPDLPGVEGSGALTVDEALSGKKMVGDKILVVGGGGTGAEIADFFSEQGKDVTIVEMLETIASDLVIHLQYHLLKRLEDKGVKILTSTKVIELGKGYVQVQDAAGTKRMDGFDTIVLAVGGEVPNNSVYKSLEGKVSELHIIGDAVKPREIIDAVIEGARTALEI
ncbi:MAG: FAD-dependent oxidoreductase [Deltaproteobacteria bacterium]|nr:FAD-dependent oxidoreductase [Deltaproteobacteria bacterium]